MIRQLQCDCISSRMATAFIMVWIYIPISMCIQTETQHESRYYIKLSPETLNSPESWKIQNAHNLSSYFENSTCLTLPPHLLFPFFFPVIVKVSYYLEYMQLEVFKRTLMQSLQEDDDSSVSAFFLLSFFFSSCFSCFEIGPVSTLNPRFVKLELRSIQSIDRGITQLRA